jgi:hypothetical protein
MGQVFLSCGSIDHFDGENGGAMKKLKSVLVLGFLVLSGFSLQAKDYTYDYVVYGGTAGGTISAIAAANQGLKVALIEPGTHIGGMTSGGLGGTDYGNKNVIGGMARDFYVRNGAVYGKDIEWDLEPHVAETILRDWLKEAKVDVFFERRVTGLVKKGTKIVSLVMDNGDGFHAPIMADASYEGDILPLAKITYTWGREGKEVYGESLAGRVGESPYHQFTKPVSAYDDEGKLLPLIMPNDGLQPGDGDKKVQAYNYRICITQREDNKVPFPKPEGYTPAYYALLERYLNIMGESIKIHDIWLMRKLPNDKVDLNNKGPVSTDYIGMSWEYPEADPARRQEIAEEHTRYIQGFLYFLVNDPRVPKHIQDEAKKWGLAKDEFVDNGHWPHQLYVREARRMVGAYVMTQKDLQTDRSKENSIGMGSYNSDSHHVQRVVLEDGTVLNEGDMQVRVQPYEMAYTSFVPIREECENLFVLSTFSASHVAYSSMRMEPQYMIIGHAAGVAAHLAIEKKSSVQDVDIQVLQAILKKQKAILSMPE